MENFHNFPFLILPLVLVVYLISSINILAEYERGVIFRLGKLLPQPKGPGVILVFAPIDRIVRVSLRTVAFEVPPQDVITRDNVSVKVSAVLYYRVVDPRRAIVEVESYQYATLQLAQTTLRSVLGQAQLDDLLAERDRLNLQLQTILDHHAEGELDASAKLAQAAGVIAAQPLSITLRYLQTLTEIASEKNSTIIFPLPIELLELLKASVSK